MAREHLGTDERQKIDSVVGELYRMAVQCLERTHFAGDSEDDQARMDALKAELMRFLPELLKAKAMAGLLAWAYIKMGDDFTAYYRNAFQDYLTVAELYQLGNDSSMRESLEKTPFTFPTRLRKNRKVIFSRVNEKFTPILARVKEIKSRTRGDDLAFGHDLREYYRELIGSDATPKTVRTYISQEPAQIALDLTRRKYRLAIGTESLKKVIAQQSDPMKLVRSFVKNYVRERK